VTAAWLWQADGPQMGTRGIVDDPGRARRLAAECLLSGNASSAVVQEAAAELGMRTLTDGYHRTGREWRGSVGAGGRVRWTQAVAA
jgi:hypothetical protein